MNRNIINNRPEVFYFLIVPFTLILIFRVLLDFNGLYGQDSHAFVHYAHQIKEYLLNGHKPGPFAWPATFSFTIAIISFIVQDLSLSAQLVSALSFGGFLYFTRKTILLLYTEGINYVDIYLITCALIAPYLVRASVIAMTEMLGIFFMTCSIYYCVRSYQRFQLSDYIIALALGVLAVTSRYPLIILLLLPLLVTAVMLLKKYPFKLPLLILITVIVFLLPHLLVQGFNPENVLEHNAIKMWSFENYFRTEFKKEFAVHSFKYPNWIFVFSSFTWPGISFLGILLLPITVIFYRRTRAIWFFFACYFLFALFSAGVNIQNARHLIPIAPFLLLIYYRPFVTLLSKSKSIIKSELAILLGIVLVQLIMCVMSVDAIIDNNREQKEVISYLKKNYPIEKIYTFAIDVSFTSYDVTNPVENIFYNEYSKFDEGSLLIMNEKRFAKTFDKKNPMINYERALQSCDLKSAIKFDNGWEIFEIKNRKLK